LTSLRGIWILGLLLTLDRIRTLGRVRWLLLNLYRIGTLTSLSGIWILGLLLTLDRIGPLGRVRRLLLTMDRVGPLGRVRRLLLNLYRIGTLTSLRGIWILGLLMLLSLDRVRVEGPLSRTGVLLSLEALRARLSSNYGPGLNR
jgi:hypothetical protein